MAKARYKDTSYPVLRLVDDIERGEIALPDLQRPYVWPAAKARDLFDSMYKGFPVGYLLFWETGVEPGTRQIGTGTKETVARQLIVDGQQRLTSLYAVIKGAPVLRDDYSTGRIRIAFRPADAAFAVHDAAVERDAEYLPDISVLWEPGNRKPAVRKFLSRLREKRDLDEAEEDRLDTALDELYELGNYTFKVVELSSSINEEEVAEVFVRINSKGVALNQADFILTLMSVFWEGGRRELEAFCRDARSPSTTGEPSAFNWFIQPKPSQLLRVTTTVALRRAVLRQVYAVLRGRSPDSEQAPAAFRDEQFGKLQRTQKHVLDLTNWHEFLACLDRAGFRSTRMISAENAVLYSYAMWLIGRVHYEVPVDRLRDVIARWFFMAHTTARYSGSFETRVENDLGRLAGVDEGDADGYTAVLDKVVEDTFTHDFWLITLPNDLETSGSKSPSLMAYIAALNVLDADALLSTGKVRGRLDPALTAKKGIERHHLFPRNHLKQQGTTEISRINQIANMALVDWNDNITISDQPPSAYWPQQLVAKNIPEERLRRQLYWHALPPEWAHMSYDDFLAARRLLMAEVVRDAFEALGGTQR